MKQLENKNDKEILRDNARDKYRNLTKEKKIKRENMEEIGIIIYLKIKRIIFWLKKKNFLIKKKQKLKEYQKHYREV